MKRIIFTNIIIIFSIYNIFIIFVIINMDSLAVALKFMNENLIYFENVYPDVNKHILRSAIIYMYLLYVYLNYNLTILEIIENENFDIGLIGPGNGTCTKICECLRNNIVFHTHSYLHDAYVRNYTKYKNTGIGYKYMFKNSPACMTKSPLFGHVTGLIYSIYHNIRN